MTLAGAAWAPWAAAVISAALLELPFPLAGPLPAWRTVFAWFGLVPLLCAVLSADRGGSPFTAQRLSARLSLRCALVHGQLLLGARTMAKYGDLPAIVPVLLLVGYSAVLGLYCGLFGLGVALVRRATGTARAGPWLPRPSCGPDWNWPPRASPAFPGTSSATPRWITPWSTSLLPGPVSTASALCWSRSTPSLPAACCSTAAPAAAPGA